VITSKQAQGEANKTLVATATASHGDVIVMSNNGQCGKAAGDRNE